MEFNERYGNDRAEIENLMSRYIFALDWLDVETYLDTFCEDAVLCGVFGRYEGREAIRTWTPEWFEYYPKKFGGTTGRPLSRHFITSLVLKVEGDVATGRAYWFNNDIQVPPYFGAFGHYEDEFRRVDGRWLISRREVFGERLGATPTRAQNPAW
jgi:ketosteroid isomerase-like protein